MSTSMPGGAGRRSDDAATTAPVDLAWFLGIDTKRRSDGTATTEADRAGVRRAIVRDDGSLPDDERAGLAADRPDRSTATLRRAVG